MADRYTEEWLKLEQALGARPCLQGTALQMREQYSGLVAAIASQLPPVDNVAVQTTDGTVDSVPYRVYTPANGARPLPVGLYTHGGGFVAGSIDSDDRVCRLIAEKTPCIVISVEYRLAPEHKVPAQLQDAMAVANWALKNASSLGGDPSKFFTLGTSAGAGLALAVANQFAKTAPDGGKNPVRGIVAMGPTAVHPDNIPAEYESLHKSYKENAVDVPVIDKASMDEFYRAQDANPMDSDTFTALSPHLAKFPATYIVTTATDPVRDDGVVVEAALKKAGVPTKRDHYDKLPHCFWIFPAMAEANKVFGANLLSGIHWVIGNM
ncbi:hypothetical protein VTN00DRAFT_2788 [Thermoascus crustaceus]|uniref:uncharacterized protein n=1 Tax=Thermoascus crustaceus TaxID=5088 RepID=UPI0037439692